MTQIICETVIFKSLHTKLVEKLYFLCYRNTLVLYLHHCQVYICTTKAIVKLYFRISRMKIKIWIKKTNRNPPFHLVVLTTKMKFEFYCGQFFFPYI